MTARSPLGELYDSVTRANGWGLRDIARRSEEGDAKLSKSRINQLVNASPLDSISAGAIYGLAAGLGVSVDRVALAAIQSMGFRVSSVDPSPAESIRRDETLSEDTRAALLAILQGARAKGVRGA